MEGMARWKPEDSGLGLPLSKKFVLWKAHSKGPAIVLSGGNVHGTLPFFMFHCLNNITLRTNLPAPDSLRDTQLYPTLARNLQVPASTLNAFQLEKEKATRIPLLISPKGHSWQYPTVVRTWSVFHTAQWSRNGQWLTLDSGQNSSVVHFANSVF